MQVSMQKISRRVPHAMTQGTQDIWCRAAHLDNLGRERVQRGRDAHVVQRARRAVAAVALRQLPPQLLLRAGGRQIGRRRAGQARQLRRRLQRLHRSQASSLSAVLV